MNFNVDELLPICDKCEGNGLMEDPILQQQNRGGYGRYLISASPANCDKCNGFGASPNEDGKALIEFFNRAKSKRLIR